MGVPSVTKALGKEGPLKTSRRQLDGRTSGSNKAFIAQSDGHRRPSIRAPRTVPELQLVERRAGGGCGPTGVHPGPHWLRDSHRLGGAISRKPGEFCVESQSMDG